MEFDPPEMSQAENAYQDQTDIDQPEMRQGQNRTEIEIIQEDNIDNQEVQCLSAKLINGDQKTKSFFSSDCIYRVPEYLRNLKESAYTPRLIAIGPLHRDDPHLKTPMQHVKMSYTNDLLRRVSEVMEGQESAEQKKLTVLQQCMAAIKESLDDSKKCYAEEVTLDVEMMLVDGCFILEFLYRNYLEEVESAAPNSENADPIFGRDSTLFAIQHDLLLLENQIPFLVLEKLFPLTVALIPKIALEKLSLTEGKYVHLPMVDLLMRPEEGKSTNTAGTAKTSCWPPDCILPVSVNRMNNSEQEVSSGNSRAAMPYHHILHKLHADYHPQDNPKIAQDDLTELLPSASELVYAGVKFIPGEGDDLFKVKFTEHTGLFWWYRRACFEIPFLVIDDTTEAVLRNLIAFEQCCPGTSQHFTSYAILIDMLVNYDKDIHVLEKARVMRNCLGAPRDVTDLFNNLSKEVSYGKFFFAETCNKAIKYKKHFWPKNLAHVRSTYFASPWTVIAFCLGFIAFGITITNFIHGFLA